MKPIRSVERAISVLFHVCQSDAPIGLSEISRGIGLDKATTLRLLITLGNDDLVQQDPVTRRYIPGPNVSRLSNFWRRDLRTVSRPYLEALMDKVQENVVLIAPRGMEKVCIETLDPPHELCMFTTIGSAVPIYRGASGRILMAFMPPERSLEIINQTGLQPMTPKSLTDNSKYLRLLRDIRRRGFALSSNDAVMDCSAVAAPIFDKEGQVIASVTVRGPSSRMNKQKQAAIVPLLLNTTKSICRELGYDELEAAAG